MKQDKPSKWQLYRFMLIGSLLSLFFQISGAIEYLGYWCWVVMCLYAVVLLVLEHCYLTEMARHDAKYKAEKEAHEIRFEQYRKWLTEPNLWVNRN